MRRYGAFIQVAVGLTILSGFLYLLHYIIFRDAHHIYIYLLTDLAFLPLEVLLVVIVVERLLARREKHARIQKLNMVMGAFFSEVGNKLLGDLVCCFESCESVRHKLAICATWTHADFDSARQFAQGIGGEVNCQKTDLSELRRFLIEKRPFLLGLLQNPTLLEHDRLTDLLWAVFHLTEELEARPSVKDLPASDREHLGGDIRRLYHHLAPEWISYAEHLRSKYPFLFSLVCRTHPLQDHPSAEVS